jgi:hypothetical protein
MDSHPFRERCALYEPFTIFRLTFPLVEAVQWLYKRM